AAIASREGLVPRGVYEQKIADLKQTLMDDDCFLPWNVREVPELSKSAKLTASEGDPEPLRNGIDRPVGDEDNGWTGSIDSWVEYTFDEPQELSQARFIFETNLDHRWRSMRCAYPLDAKPIRVHPGMVKAFRIETMGGDGQWQVAAKVENNYQRLARVPLDVETTAIRFVPEATWGAEQVHVFAWDVR
ncbi:MAG: hypothetical protein GXP25_14840, partial [Planctomycetes bacterium]|nr:hypothetical protein [Planctomycetota bacterium]